MTDETKQPQEPEVLPNTPEYYADGFWVSWNLYGATVMFGDIRQGKPMLVKAKIKMSPQTMKHLGLLLRKFTQDYEEKNGNISLPINILHEFGIE